MSNNADDAIAPPIHSTSLAARVRAGGAFVSFGFAANQALRLASNLILTRLLAPEAFGLVAAAISISVLAVMMSDIGINSSIIRSNHSDDPRFLHTAWTLSIARNALLWIFMIAVAAALAYSQSAGGLPERSIFSAPEAPAVIVVFGFQVFVAGFNSPNAVMAGRRVQMGRVVGLSFAGQVLTTCITVALAITGLGVWAIVYGMVVGTMFSVVASHFFFSGPKMRIAIQRDFAREIFGFGKWLLLASLFGFVTAKGDSLIFGWQMNEQDFGLYSVAAIWSLAAIAVLDSVRTQVLYPAFSEIRRMRKHDLARVYRQCRLLLDGAAFFLGISGIFLSTPVFNVLYNDTFEGASHYLKLLMPLILLQPYKLLDNIILAEGDSRSFTWVTFVTGATTLIFAPLGFRMFGPEIGVLVFAAAPLLAAPLAVKIASKSMPIDLLTEARAAILTLLAVIYLLVF